MQQFTDNQNQVWTLSIDIPSRKRIREETGFDVFAVVEPGIMEKLQEPETLVSVIVSLCKPQIDKLGLSPEQFASRFTGDTLEDATQALAAAIADFFPSRQRAVMLAALAKGRELQEAVTTEALTKIQALTPSKLPPMSSDTFSGLPESLAST